MAACHERVTLANIFFVYLNIFLSADPPSSVLKPAQEGHAYFATDVKRECGKASTKYLLNKMQIFQMHFIKCISYN